MIRFVLSLLCVVASLGVSLSADRYIPLPPDLDGSMMPLDTALFTPGKWIPDSLRPVYAAYVSRHGARYLSGPKKVESLKKTLTGAADTGNLSETGIAFRTIVDEVESVNSDNWGDLSPIGIEEQKIMGRRVFDFLSPLRHGAPDLQTISSYVPRCVMTMYQFSVELLRNNDSISIASDEGHQFNPLLCCFIADEAYARYRSKGDWREVYDDFVKRHISAEPARRLFRHTDLSGDRLREMTMAMYEMLKGNRAAGLPAPTTQWMSVNEYRACWEADNLSHYLRNCITPLSSLAARATTPLARRIINDLDSAASSATPDPVINGYFGHAETLMPLLSLLKIEGCFALPLDYDDLASQWKVQNVTPLGANLLIVLSKGPSGETYASIQLNGRTVTPVPGRPEFIPWSELRAYWRDIIDNFL